MGFLGVFFAQILSKFVSMAAIIIALFVAAFAALWLLGTDLGSWLFGQVLDLAIFIMNTISFDFNAMNVAQYITILPAETRNMLGVIGAGQAIALIIGAIGVRLLLQVIPFTRLGS
ncbi:DUF2523 family protein [Aquitalea aquatica]|uniref:DUF2523 domain-containing protein n=1 Tax=Aquitalea aquatica TaxID=3044273 RepID=A0A838YHE7_9NEIS|nr:DUF2523 family protein [Aquitalea magnusonii]MBA4710475.1 DUF2523 domain-containing protein [Aquitalea magnusonii]